MAIKALFAIREFLPETDGSWRVTMDIWSGSNSAQGEPNDEYFAMGALATTVNASLHTYVESYIQSQWSVSFNPLTDSVKMLNPVSLL